MRGEKKLNRKAVKTLLSQSCAFCGCMKNVRKLFWNYVKKKCR